MRIRSIATCLVLGTVGVLVPTATANAAAPVVATCGATLTTDAYLTSDLTCTGQKGLTIGGNIRLDLRNHKLTGPGSSSNSEGIAILNGYKPQVSNGTVQNWGIGILFDDPYDLATGSPTVTNVSFRSNSTGIALGTYAQWVIDKSKFLNNGTGVGSGFNAHATITNSIFRGNQTAVYIDDSGVTLSTSVVDRNTTGVYCYEAYCELSGVTITNNQVGASIGFIGPLKITRSIIAGNAAGVVSSLLTTVDLTYNAFTRNKTAVTLAEGYGTIFRNSFTSNDIGIASVYAYEAADVSRTIEANVAINNGDAFYLTGAGDKLKANTAKRNHRFGIYAPHAIDLGGNKASGNRANPQCVGVVCR